MAATRSIALQIAPTSGSSFEFDVQGEYTSRIAFVHNEASEVTEVRHEWVFDRALIRTADGTAASAWDRYHALMTLAEARSGNDKIASIKIIRDPDGAAVEELDLSDSLAGWEQFRLEEVEAGGPGPLSPAAVWNTVVPITLRISALKRNADANGITDIEQRVSNTYTNGLHKLIWDTVISTKEGVDAVAKAKEFAAIDIGSYGTRYAYQTNGPDGISWDELDSDNVSAGGPRTTTQVRALSVIQQFGVDVGTTAPGNSPDTVDYAIRDEITRDETIRTVFARAEGPGAQAWVLARKPAGGVWSEDKTNGSAGNVYEATWTRKIASTPDPVKDARLISVQISGGAREQRWEASSAGTPSELFEGGFTPYVAQVSIEVQATGTELKSGDMPLPGLPDGWVLDRNNSSEGAPELAPEGRAADEGGDRWVRKASLVLRRATKPELEPLQAIRNATPVVSYFL